MDPRLRWAGGAALAVLLAVIPTTAGPASAQASPPSPPTLTGLCWMGSNRPILRARNTDSQQVMQYTLRSGTATRSGTVGPARPSGASDVAHFVGTGRFPAAAETNLAWSIRSTSGTLASTAAESTYCTYDLQPEIRWRGADGQPIAAPAAAPGLVVTLAGPLEQLSCTWATSGLDCTQQAVRDAPLAPGTFRPTRNELQVPAFAVGGKSPSYTAAVVPPVGFRVLSGSGTFGLDDLGTGLGQGNVDARIATFLPLKSSGGTQDRALTITVQQGSAPAPTTKAAPTTAAVTTTPSTPPTSAAEAAPTTARPTAPPPTVAPPVPQKAPAATAPAAPTPTAAVLPTVVVAPGAPAAAVPDAPLPRTGFVRPGVVFFGLVLLGAGLVVLAVGRRRRSVAPPHWQ